MISFNKPKRFRDNQMFHFFQASEKERYSVEELLSDLANCQARQVHLLVDQSFAGEVSRSVKRSNHHRNVVVYASSKDHEYSWGSEYTHLWTHTNHTHKCAQDVFKVGWMYKSFTYFDITNTKLRCFLHNGMHFQIGEHPLFKPVPFANCAN